MRLVAFLLSTALVGQVPQLGNGPRLLPWQTGTSPPWQPLSTIPVAQPGPIAQSEGPIRVQVLPDGTLESWNGAGVRTLRTGLPGRPGKAWRDGGIPLVGVGTHWAFPLKDPLSEGLGGLDWSAGDFRSSLQGLLWVLEDGERFLTVVHPATAQVVYLPLPRGEDFDLIFEATRLVLVAKRGPEGQAKAWALPWLALLPQFARLGPPSTPPVQGTALKPFPTGQ